MPTKPLRLDAHQHFWRFQAAEYPWISGPLAALGRDYLPDDLRPLLAAGGFDGSIAVQARQSLQETHWLLELAQRFGIIKGVVGWVDLRSPSLDEQLRSFAGNARLVGVRHVVQDEPDDRFLLRDDVRRGIGQLDARGLAYDLLLFPRHLPIAAELVNQFPSQRFVLDHLAKPPIGKRQLQPWRDELRKLATFPNVACKLSGMVTETHWKQWRPADFHPYLDAALDAFGPRRLMIGSDWPVCTLSGDYAATMGIVTDYAQRLTPDEQAGILGENAARIYRLPR